MFALDGIYLSPMRNEQPRIGAMRGFIRSPAPVSRTLEPATGKVWLDGLHLDKFAIPNKHLRLCQVFASWA